MIKGSEHKPITTSDELVPSWWHWQMFKWGHFKNISQTICTWAIGGMLLGLILLMISLLSMDYGCGQKVQEQQSAENTKLEPKQMQEALRVCKVEQLRLAEKRWNEKTPENKRMDGHSDGLGVVQTTLQKTLMTVGALMQSVMHSGSKPVQDKVQGKSNTSEAAKGPMVQVRVDATQLWMQYRDSFFGSFGGMLVMLVLSLVGLLATGVMMGVYIQDKEKQKQYYHLHEIVAYKKRFLVASACALMGVLVHIGMGLCAWLAYRAWSQMDENTWKNVKRQWSNERVTVSVVLFSMMVWVSMYGIYILPWNLKVLWEQQQLSSAWGAYMHVWVYTWLSPMENAAIMQWILSGISERLMSWGLRVWSEGIYTIGMLLCLGTYGLIALIGTEKISSLVEKRRLQRQKGKKAWCDDLEQVLVQEERAHFESLMQKVQLEKMVLEQVGEQEEHLTQKKAREQEGLQGGSKGSSVSSIKRL